jgi:hypothetical protein
MTLVLCQTCKYSFPKTVFYFELSLENFRNNFDTALEPQKNWGSVFKHEFSTLI